MIVTVITLREITLEKDIGEIFKALTEAHSLINYDFNRNQNQNNYNRQHQKNSRNNSFNKNKFNNAFKKRVNFDMERQVGRTRTLEGDPICFECQKPGHIASYLVKQTPPPT